MMIQPRLSPRQQEAIQRITQTINNSGQKQQSILLRDVTRLKKHCHAMKCIVVLIAALLIYHLIRSALESDISADNEHYIIMKTPLSDYNHPVYTAPYNSQPIWHRPKNAVENKHRT